MQKTVEEIVQSVRIVLDENSVNIAFIESDTDTLDLNDIIKQHISAAVRSIVLDAPSTLLDGGTDLSAQTLYWENEVGIGMGYIILPDDFLRLVIFQMSDWKRPVTKEIKDTDAQYFMQKSKYLGIRGGISKPVCALTTSKSSKIMEFYSCIGGETVEIEKARYIPIPDITAETIEIPTRLVDACILTIAGLTCVSIKEANQATQFFELSKSLINGKS